MCCKQCFESLGSENASTASLWLEMCRQHVNAQGVFLLRETRVPMMVPHLNRLEKLGYILTADGQNAIQVRVNGCDVMDIESMSYETFCIDRKSHKNKWA